MLLFPDTVQTLSMSLESPEYDGDVSGTMAFMDFAREPVFFLERTLENSNLRTWKDKTSGKGNIIPQTKLKLHNITLVQF